MNILYLIVVWRMLTTDFVSPLPAPAPFVAVEHCITPEEVRLYELIMAYRKSKRLPTIPCSASLTKVAQLHVRDLAENQPDQGDCNMHSWSDKGSWSSCCYTSDHAQANCMWRKPSELTEYKGIGYEISYGASWASVTAEGALAGWKSSPGHNEVMINQGIWKEKWNAVGIGIYKGYAVVWFGREKDPAGWPAKCEN